MDYEGMIKMRIRKIIFMIFIAFIIFGAGFLTETLIGNAKIANLRKQVNKLRQNVVEADKHALNLQNDLDRIKKSASMLETLNKELKTEAQSIEKNLHHAIESNSDIGNGIKSASQIASTSKKDLDELAAIIQGIKNNSVSN